MKKLFLSFVVLILSISFVNAVPAYPGLVKKTQPNGTTISFYLRGDEHFSFKMSEDGYLLALNADGVFEYADFRDNSIIPMGVKASDITKRSIEEVDFLQKAVKVSEIQMQLEETIKVRRQQREERNVQRAIKFPTNGSPKSLVILVNFQDVKFLKETANLDFTNMLNQDGYSENGGTSSAREYFRTSSFGQFDPNFVVVGPYDLPENVAYYGSNSPKTGNDENPDSMVVHACRLADEAGLDFTEFDTDGNGYLDNVFIYYAGHNEAEHGGEDRIWPHRSGVYSKTRFDGIRLNSYACTSELKGSKGTKQCGIGTFVHEFGHVIELPDLYVTDYSHSEPTLGKWDVMDQGPYNNEGRTPPVYSAYERFFLGWLKPEPLDSFGLHSLEPLITSNKAYILSRTSHNLDGYSPDPEEFFMLENRQKIGIDSLGVPGEDLLITHIKYDKKLWMTGLNNPNKNPDDMCVQIECAAGTTNEPKRNTFPGADNIFDFRFIFKDGQLWDAPLSGIHKKDGDIFFLYGEIEDYPVITFKNTLTDFYCAANKKQFKKLDVVVRNVEGELKFSFENTNFYLVAERNADGTFSNASEELILNVPSKDEHTLSVVVGFYPRNRFSNEEFFESRILVESDNFITALPIRGKSRRAEKTSIPVAFDPINVTENTFVAKWSFDKLATAYYLSVYTKENAVSEEEEEFDGFAEGNTPKGWSYNFLATNKTYKASSPLSVAFTTSEDTLWTKDYLLPVSSLDFWVRSHNNAKGNIIVDGFIDSMWVNVVKQSFDDKTINEIISVDLEEECYKFRICVQFDSESGSLLFDDFKAKFNYTASYIVQDEEVFQEEEGEDNRRTIREYNPKVKYYYRVRATDKENSDIEGKYENVTEFSNEICVNGNKKKNNKVEPLNISFVDGLFVVNLKELRENYVIYIYSADGSLVEEIEPTSKKVVLPRLDANMYLVKYSEKGKVSRKDQVGKIFY